MSDAENILKSLVMAGVEWELDETAKRHPEMENKDAPDRDNNDAAASEPARKTERQSMGFSVPKPTAPISNADILETANRLADMPDIVAAIKSFREHPLYNGAKNTAAPVILPGAPLLVITDMPSLSDDQTGRILSGADGELFDKMMAAIGLDRAGISIAPLMFWRPAGGRTPTADELAFCRPFIGRIMKDAGAKKILTLGALAAKEIAGAILPRDHGKAFGENIIPIYKPDFISQNPDVKKDVWQALKAVISY